MGIKDVWRKIKDWLLAAGLVISGLFAVISFTRVGRLEQKNRELERRIDYDLGRIRANIERAEQRIQNAIDGFGDAKGDVTAIKRGLAGVEREIKQLGESINRSGNELDRGIELSLRIQTLSRRLREAAERAAEIEEAD
jgi:predicted RNase H-like nuclease (RuvC/YqgF family)